VQTANFPQLSDADAVKTGFSGYSPIAMNELEKLGKKNSDKLHDFKLTKLEESKRTPKKRKSSD
jgi:hypothetical protein